MNRPLPRCLALATAAWLLAGCDAGTISRVAAAALPVAASPAPAGSTSPAPAGSTPPAPAGSTSPAPAGSTSPAPARTTSPAPAGTTSPAPASAAAVSAFAASFEQDTPDPAARGAEITAMSAADTAAAVAAFGRGYAARKGDPYEVLKMLLGAYALVHLNQDLGVALAAVVVEGGEAPFKNGTGIYWVNELAKKAYAPQTFRSYYVGTVAPDYQVADFAKRVIRVNKDGGNTTDQTVVADPRSLSPKAPKAGDKHYWGVLPGANKLPRTVGMTFGAEGGWKVNPSGTITIGI